MPWQNILGHDALVEKFRRAFQKNRLTGSFLFIGPGGIGKKAFAFALAKTLLCKRTQNPQKTDGFSKTPFEPCGVCESCQMFPEHPDFFFVSKPHEKTFIPLELLIGSKELRGKEGLCFEISRTPFLGKRKIAVIDDADYFNAEGANALLKTLEEPPPDSLLILIGTSAGRQLPTIRSRCQMIRFAPLSVRNLATILWNREIVESFESGLKLANRAVATGVCSVERAEELLDEKLETFQEQLYSLLAGKPWNSVKLASFLNEFVELAGKEAQPRRKRLRTVFGLVLSRDRVLLEKSSNEKQARFLLHRIEKTLDALDQINRNANLPLIVDHWALP